MTFHKLILNTLFCSLMITEYLKLQTTPVIYIHDSTVTPFPHSKEVLGVLNSIPLPGQGKRLGGKLVG